MRPRPRDVAFEWGYTRRVLSFAPTPCYCEENVWMLGHEPWLKDVERYVVFVSNSRRQCPLWEQSASDRADGAIVWDYHVFLIAAGDVQPPSFGGEIALSSRAPSSGSREDWGVWDIDSRLGMPVGFWVYFDGTFSEQIPPAFLPSFRVVPFDAFKATFGSDRSHMLLPDGTYQAPVPPWPLIQAGGLTMNLMHFVDMSSDFVGDVLDLWGMRARFG